MRLGVSTGEAQRVALARAFLREAGLWLLAEPTAHWTPKVKRHWSTRSPRRPAGARLIATHSPTVSAIADQQWEIVDADLLLTQACQPVPW
jgi:ATP-binding cassette subfamily C protein CydD